MKKILAFCFFPAFVPPSNGGQSRLFNFYRALSRWHHVTLLTSTHIGVQEEVVHHGLNFIERRIPKDEHFVQQYAALEPYSSGGDLSGPAVSASGQSPTNLHRAYLEEYEQADVIFHDFPFTVGFDLFAGLDRKLRVYNAHNCETVLYGQLHPGEKSCRIHELVRAAEQRVLSNVDLVLYCNADDLKSFSEIAPGAHFDALYTPNGVTPNAATERPSAPKSDNFRAVFMGSGHPPNVRAAEFIAHALAPALPDVTFDIIGSCLPMGRYPDNVKRHGVVDEATKASILSVADLALNPMAAGSGSNVKVLEYFAYGVPVLSTSFGMRGIEAEGGKEYIEATLDCFADKLRWAAENRATSDAIGGRGKALALETYTWNAIASSVADRLELLVRRRAGEEKRRFVLALNDYDSFEGIGGGGTRTRGIYEAVRNWCDVVFVSFSTSGTLTARKYDEGIFVVNVPKTPAHLADQMRVNAQFHVSADDIISGRHAVTNPWLNAVYGALRRSARCVVVEHCYLSGLPLSFGDRFVYSSQNNETELKSRLLEWHPLRAELLPEVERIERLAVERSAATIAVSYEDAASLVKGKCTAGPVIVVRNGAAAPARGEDVDRTKQEVRSKVGDRAVVFLGSAHMPNVEAAQFMCKQLAPKCPDVRFHVLGSVCSAIANTPPNVVLWGIVDEVTKSAVMQSCTLALNPMNSGSGSNVKVADYLGNGLFVVTTEFGQRGYPESIRNHVAVAPIGAFAEVMVKALEDTALHSDRVRAERQMLFSREFAMQGLARRFVETLQMLERRKKRVLYVAYRYAFPALGGAEANIEKFVSALGNSGEFDVDVIAPQITGIHNYLRFSETYSFDADFGIPVDIPNVRFARFPVDGLDSNAVDLRLRNAWSAQPQFERCIDRELCPQYEETGLTWGWAYPEGEDEHAARWAFTGCGMFLCEEGCVDIEGFTPNAVVTAAYSHDQLVGGPWTLEGRFSLSFQAQAGEVQLTTSTTQQIADPRPLAFRVSKISVGDHPVDLSMPTLVQAKLQTLPAEQQFRLLDRASQNSRALRGVRLTDGRGPWSASLERFIADHVAEYDLVVTHNNVFRPAIVAVEEAKKRGVPSILIPHAHLDDDFYHFPDLLKSAADATLVLAVPKAACDFLGEKGCNVRYLPAGCDASEEFAPEDEQAFRQLHGSTRPFVLVLGRKAGAKGYRLIIDAVERLNRKGVDLQVVLIGPDDDGLTIDSPNAVYLGRQPRHVVRGALLSCFALCNMSRSESFGIVLLEAWLAGKAVIANKNCVAFHDMAQDGVNAIMVDENGLEAALLRVLQSPALSDSLAAAGRLQVQKFSWEKVCSDFIGIASKVSRARMEEMNA